MQSGSYWGLRCPGCAPSPSGCAAGGTGVSGSSRAPCSVSMQVTHPCFCIPIEMRPKGCEKLPLEQLHFACFVFEKENDLCTPREGSNCGAEPIQECQPQASPVVCCLAAPAAGPVHSPCQQDCRHLLPPPTTTLGASSVGQVLQQGLVPGRSVQTKKCWLAFDNLTCSPKTTGFGDESSGDSSSSRAGTCGSKHARYGC